MSNNSLTKFERPLQLELKPSRILATVLVILHLLVLLAWSRVPLATPLYCLIVLAVPLSGWLCYRRVAGYGGYGVVSGIAWDKVRGWRVYRSPYGWSRVVPLTPVYITRFLTIAAFRTGRLKSCHVVVVNDRLSEYEFRRLRARLLQSVDGG